MTDRATDLDASLDEREWRLIREESRDGAMNMALDEIAGETAASGGPRTVRVYRWEPSTLSLGYRQNPSTVDWEFCEREGATRRPPGDGGGGIYHDSWGDLSYSIAAPAAELPGDLMESYELLCAPVLDAFERLGVEVRFAAESRPALYGPACYLRALHPAHDVVAADGRKISGNAQYRRRDSVVQHGSVQFACVPEAHLAVFAGGVTPEEFGERVTSIREQADGATDAVGERDRASAVRAFEDALGEWADAEEGEWTDDELDRARERASGKYEAEDWNRDREAPAR
jgi:lipoate-protein ligase A